MNKMRIQVVLALVYVLITIQQLLFVMFVETGLSLTMKFAN